MKTWLKLILLLISCNGCTMMEDMLFVDDGPPGYPLHQSAAQPPGTCGMNVPIVAASQTAEPELLQVRK